MSGMINPWSFQKILLLIIRFRIWESELRDNYIVMRVYCGVIIAAIDSRNRLSIRRVLRLQDDINLRIEGSSTQEVMICFMIDGNFD